MCRLYRRGVVNPHQCELESVSQCVAFRERLTYADCLVETNFNNTGTHSRTHICEVSAIKYIELLGKRYFQNGSTVEGVLWHHSESKANILCVDIRISRRHCNRSEPSSSCMEINALVDVLNLQV